MNKNIFKGIIALVAMIVCIIFGFHFMWELSVVSLWFIFGGPIAMHLYRPRFFPTLFKAMGMK